MTRRGWAGQAVGGAPAGRSIGCAELRQAVEPISRTASSLMPGSMLTSTLRTALRGEGRGELEGGQLIDLVDCAQAAFGVIMMPAALTTAARPPAISRSVSAMKEGTSSPFRRSRGRSRPNGFQPTAPIVWPDFIPDSARMSFSGASGRAAGRAGEKVW